MSLQRLNNLALALAITATACRHPAAKASVASFEREARDSIVFLALQAAARDTQPSLLTSVSSLVVVVPRVAPVSGCGRGLEIDFTWQWSITALGHSLSILREATDPARPGDTRNPDGTVARGDATIAFEDFVLQQGHNPTVSAAYRRCWVTSPKEFLEGVAAAASGMQLTLSYTWPGIAENLRWQWTHNRRSILDAQREFAQTGWYLSRARGMHYVLYGQRHNHGVMSGYRAAFRDDPNQFMAIVNSFR
jgi:hypothetical protein